jgi:chromosome condensin MukBEF ATPase and DNA-binding subunit MukB
LLDVHVIAKWRMRGCRLVFTKEAAKLQRKQLARLQNLAESLNCRLVPIQ